VIETLWKVDLDDYGRTMFVDPEAEEDEYPLVLGGPADGV